MNPRQRKDVDLSTYTGRLAERLRKLREKSGLSVKEVAAITGISKSTIEYWENGMYSPVHEKLPKLAETYSVKIRTLLPEK